jgi:hypothetical protein
MPFRRVPIPQSQKNIVRQTARTAWRSTLTEKGCDHALAIWRFDKDLRLKIGSAWVQEGSGGPELGHALIDHWDAHGIVEPSSVYQRGEPGTIEDWDEG